MRRSRLGTPDSHRVRFYSAYFMLRNRRHLQWSLPRRRTTELLVVLLRVRFDNHTWTGQWFSIFVESWFFYTLKDQMNPNAFLFCAKSTYIYCIRNLKLENFKIIICSKRIYSLYVNIFMKITIFQNKSISENFSKGFSYLSMHSLYHTMLF